MYKSMKIHRAMLAVVDTAMFTPAVKLEILEVLAHEKSMEEMIEEHQRKQEEAKNG